MPNQTPSTKLPLMRAFLEVWKQAFLQFCRLFIFILPTGLLSVLISLSVSVLLVGIFLYVVAGGQLMDAFGLLLAGNIPTLFLISSFVFIVLVFLVSWLIKSLFIITTLLAAQMRQQDVSVATVMSCFFGESLRLIWPYISIAVCRFVYVVWPTIAYMLLFLLFITVFAVIFPDNNIDYVAISSLILTIIVFVLGLRFLPIKGKDQHYSWGAAIFLSVPGVVLFWAIWRAMCVALAIPLLVMHKKQPDPAKCIRTSITIARQNAPLFVYSLIAFAIVIIGLNRLIAALENGILFSIIENDIAPAFLTMIIQGMDQHLLDGLASNFGLISDSLVSSVFAVLLVIIMNALFFIAIFVPFSALFYRSLAKVADAK